MACHVLSVRCIRTSCIAQSHGTVRDFSITEAKAKGELGPNVGGGKIAIANLQDVKQTFTFHGPLYKG